MRITLSALVLAGAMACRGQPSVHPVTEWPLARGGTVHDLVPNDSGTVLLVFEPDHLFRCVTLLPNWLELRRERPGRVQIVLTRPPTASERVSMTTRRIGFDGVLRAGFSSRSVQPPEVYVLREDTVFYRSALDETRYTTSLTDSILARPAEDPAQIAKDVTVARQAENGSGLGATAVSGKPE